MEANGARLNIAVSLFYMGDIDAALVLVEECKGIAHEQLLSFSLTSSLGLQARIAIARHDLDSAGALLREALVIRLREAKKTEFIGGLYGIVDTMAALAGAQGQAGRAARLRGIADNLIALNHHYRPANFAREYAPYMAKARETMGDTAFDAAYAEGYAMPLDQAVAYAMSDG